MSKKINVRNVSMIILAVCIILYPLVSSFFGIDIGDTGIHYTNFLYIYTRRDIAGYSTVLTSIIGHAWLSVFGNLGIWGLNLLEVFVEWGLAALTFFFIKNYCGKIETLIGTLIATVSAGCYLNIFNYHQFSVLLILLLLFFVFKAIKKNKLLFSIFAGVTYALAVFARFSSLACIIVLVLYIYGFSPSTEKRIKCIIKHIAVFLGSAFVMLCLAILFLKLNHILKAFATSVLKLKGMTQTTSSSYSMGSLIDNLIWSNIKTFASPLILLGATVSFIVAVYFFMRQKEFFCRFIVPVVLIAISVCLVKFSYDVNPAGGSPQFTTGYNFLFGIFACFAVGMFIFEHLRKRRETALLYLISILFPLLVMAGSNTGSKHIIISMWLVAPLFVFGVKKAWLEIRHTETKNLPFKRSCAAGLVFGVLAIMIKYGHMVYNTNNFESLHRTKITQTVLSDNFKFLHTTERQQRTLDGLTLAYSDLGTQDTPMVVFGTGAGIYALLETDPYIRAWLVDSAYSSEQFKADLNKNDIKPDIVYCKTNQYFGYDEDVYEDLIKMVKRNAYSGKKQVLEEYLVENKYTLVYEDDYYCLFSCNADGNPCLREELYSVFY